MFLTSFFKRKTVPTKSMAEKNHDFWMNDLQTLFFKDGQEVLVIRGRDIECCWCDNHGYKLHRDNKKYHEKCDFMIRTRSGGEFSLSYESWLKVRFENPEYVMVK
jgi:hypothetical protein